MISADNHRARRWLAAMLFLFGAVALACSGCPNRPPPVKTKGVPTKTYSGIAFATIEPGSFVMGSPDREPGRDPAMEQQREVRIANRFALSVREITAAEYWSIVDRSRAVDEAEKNLPMVQVDWDEANRFCELLSKENPGKKFRLPTESEWEYACRAGTSGMYALWRGEPSLDEAARAAANGDLGVLNRRTPSLFRFNEVARGEVGKFEANSFGLYDMHGNVWEWCNEPGPNDPRDAPSLYHRPIRGGAWTSTTPLDCRSAKRAWQRKEGREAKKDSIGFRVLLENPD